MQMEKYCRHKKNLFMGGESEFDRNTKLARLSKSWPQFETSRAVNFQAPCRMINYLDVYVT